MRRRVFRVRTSSRTDRTRAGYPGRSKTPAPHEHAGLIEAAKRQYDVLCRQFAEKTTVCGYERAARYYWYHTIDLGEGLVTPGDYDFRDTVQRFPFAADMTGMTVLDVGSATGFFAFEFERRGAAVTSVDLPSIADWDMAFADRDQTLAAIRAWAGTDVLATVDERVVHGGFQFCHQMLGSTVKRCLSNVYDLTPEKLGAEGFDLVFVGDMLAHTMAPLKALNVLATLCRKTMIISDGLPEIGGATPVMVFVGGDRAQGSRSWWHANEVCWTQMLKRLGFADVRVAGHHDGVVRRVWTYYNRAILVATKGLSR
jgi:SAM-dependent methyltransferase